MKQIKKAFEIWCQLMREEDPYLIYARVYDLNKILSLHPYYYQLTVETNEDESFLSLDRSTPWFSRLIIDNLRKRLFSIEFIEKWLIMIEANK